MAKHMPSTPGTASTQEEWVPETVEQLTRRTHGDTANRLESYAGSALLTDVQRAALRWLSSFD